MDRRSLLVSKRDCRSRKIWSCEVSLDETHIDARRRSNELNASSRRANEERVEAICKRWCNESTSQYGGSDYANVVESVEDDILHNLVSNNSSNEAGKAFFETSTSTDNICPWSARQQLHVPRMLSLSLLLSTTSRSVHTRHNLQHSTPWAEQNRTLSWRH